MFILFLSETFLIIILLPTPFFYSYFVFVEYKENLAESGHICITPSVEKDLEAIGDRIQPIERHGLKVMSMGFIAPGDKPLIWRGPMLHNVIQQFLRQVDWGGVEFLVVDLPPARLTPVRTPEPAKTTAIAAVGGEQRGGRRDQNLPGGLPLPALRTFHPPRETRLRDVDAERVHRILATQLGRNERAGLCAASGDEGQAGEDGENDAYVFHSRCVRCPEASFGLVGP